MNPAYAEHDVGAVDPVDIAPLISGDAPIVTVPASEDQDVAEDTPEDDEDDGPDEDMIARRPEETMREMYSFLGEISEQIRAFNTTMRRSASSSQPPVVPDTKLWDTGLAWEREFDLYPDASRDVIRSRLYNQVWNLLHKMKERVTQQTWKTEDHEIVEGLINIMILSVRNNISTDQTFKDHVENHAA